MAPAAAILMATAGAVQAGPCATFSSIDSFANGGNAIEGASCSTYLTEEGSTGASCHWGFDYRDAAAHAFADQLLSALADCRPGVAAGPDMLVNHPDSYDLIEWQTDEGTYALSVKDKGNLGKTFVFLRRTAPSGKASN